MFETNQDKNFASCYPLGSNGFAITFHFFTINFFHMTKAFLLPTLLLLSSLALGQNCRPEVLVYNGVATVLTLIDTNNDGNTDKVGARVSAKDFVRYARSSCAAGALSYRIARADESNGAPPADSTLLLECGEKGLLPVEIWVGDPEGHWNYSQTYVLVQDNQNYCFEAGDPLPTDCSDDQLAPYLVVLNGIAAAPVADGNGGSTLRVLASSLVVSARDNCAAGYKLRIRKSGFGFGVPDNAYVNFDCNELGTNPVEVWAGDDNGNWTWVETFVKVVDAGQCTNTVAGGCTPDLIAPQLAVTNGLAIGGRLRSDGKIAIARANQFVRSNKDNCGTNSTMRIAKADDGGSTPPTTSSVKFDCDELGIQPVVIWVKDAAENWTHVETYILIQDNYGFCGQAQKIARVYAPEDKLTTLSKPAQQRDYVMPIKPASSIQVAPNPTSTAFVLRADVPESGRAQANLFDNYGRMVKTLLPNQSIPSGAFSQRFDLSELPAGLYWCVWQMGKEVQKIAVVKE